MSPLPAVEIDRFVEAEGELVKHLTGMKCWCHDDQGRPDPNCDEHENGGYLYVNERQITGLVTGISNRKDLLETGLFLPGDCIFSPLSGEPIAEMDKIVFTWPLPHGTGDALVRGDEDTDTLYYEAVKAIFCIDENRTVYKEGRDFRFVGRTIEWQWEGKPVDGIAPAAGKRYTVKYQAFLEWIAFFPPDHRISHGEDIGAKVFLRRKHLWEGA